MLLYLGHHFYLLKTIFNLINVQITGIQTWNIIYLVLSLINIGFHGFWITHRFFHFKCGNDDDANVYNMIINDSELVLIGFVFLIIYKMFYEEEKFVRKNLCIHQMYKIVVKDQI